MAEDLCLVVRLDTQSLSRMERSETLLHFAQEIFVHGTTSSEIPAPPWKHQAPSDCSEYSFRPTAWEHEVPEDSSAFLINLLDVVDVAFGPIAFGFRLTSRMSALPPIAALMLITALFRGEPNKHTQRQMSADDTL